MIKCKLCNKDFSTLRGFMNHLVRTHNYTSEQYYLEFLGKQRYCAICGKPTKYLGLTKGFREHCSYRCMGLNQSEEKIKIIANKNRGRKHTEETKLKLSKMMLKNPRRYWLNKKRPEMMKLKGWNHTGKTWEEIMGVEKARERRLKLKTKEYSDKMRKNGLKAKHRRISKAEIKLKEFLEKNNIIFEQQFKYKYGSADFYLPKYNTIIECYGKYWHNLESYIIRDKRKNKYLIEKGFNIIIYWSEDIIKKGICLNELKNLLKNKNSLVYVK